MSVSEQIEKVLERVTILGVRVDKCYTPRAMMSLEEIERCIERVREMAARAGKPLTDEILAQMREALKEQYEGYGLPFVERPQSGKNEEKLHSLREDGAKDARDLLMNRPPGDAIEQIPCACGRYHCFFCELTREINTEIERRKKEGRWTLE